MGAAITDQAAAAPEPTPAPAPETPAAPDAGAPPAGSEGTPPTPAAAEPAAPPEGHVPYPRFRDVQTQFTRFRRETETARQQWERERAERDQRIEQLAAYERDLRAWEAVMREHPDIAEAIRERLGGRTPTRQAPSNQPLHPALAEGLKRLEKLTAGYEEAQRRQHQENQRVERDQLRGELHGILKTQLGKWKYGDNLLPHLEAYVMQRSAELGLEDFEDVPFLANEWYRGIEQLRQNQAQATLAGKAQDRTVLAPTPPGSAPVLPGGRKISFEDGSAEDAMVEGLKQYGWGNGARG